MVVYTEDIIRLLIAIAVGGLIGLEREFRDKDAGFRTLILICSGSAIFSILSFRLTPPGSDPTRILSNIVTGVGFLGAGVILHMNNRSIRGVTTAATVWLVAALGMGIGSGQILYSIIGAAIILFVMLAFPPLEKRINQLVESRTYQITTGQDLKFQGELRKLFQDSGLKIYRFDIQRDRSEFIYCIVTLGSLVKQDTLLSTLLKDQRILRVTY